MTTAVTPKRMGGLAGQTPEQRAANLAKARISRAEKAAARKASTLRRDFDEASEWERLASVYRVRLPPWGLGITVSNITTFLHKLGRSRTWYARWSGEQTIDQFREQNSGWGARALAGIILEEHDRELSQVAA